MSTDNTYTYWNSAANEYFNNNQLDLAEGAVEKALSFPEAMNTDEAYLLAGNIYYQKKQYDRADLCLDMAFSVSKNNWRTFALKGINCIAIGYDIILGAYKGRISDNADNMFKTAFDAFEQGLYIAKAEGDTYGEGYVQGFRAYLLYNSQGLEAANEALTEAFRLGDPSGQAAFVLEDIDNEKKTPEAVQANDPGDSADPGDSVDPGKIWSRSSDNSRITLYSHAFLAAKLYGQHDGPIGVRFVTYFVENRVKLAERISRTHLEMMYIYERIKLGHDRILNGAGAEEISEELNYLVEKPELFDDVYYALLVAAYVAFLDRNNKDRQSVASAFKIFEDALEKNGMMSNEVQGFETSATLCAALWFADYRDFRKLVMLNVKKFVEENWYGPNNNVDLVEIMEDYRKCLLDLYDIKQPPIIEEDNGVSIWEEAGSLGMQECAELAAKYYNGTDRIHDFKKALKLVETPAFSGNLLAMELMGRMYFNGDGIPRRREEGKKLLAECIERGDEAAKSFLITAASTCIKDYDEKLQFLTRFEQVIRTDTDTASADKESGRRFVEYYREISEYLPIAHMQRLSYLTLLLDQQPELMFKSSNFVSTREFIDEFEAYLAETDENDVREILSGMANEDLSGRMLLELASLLEAGIRAPLSDTNWSVIDNYIKDRARGLGITIKTKR